MRRPAGSGDGLLNQRQARDALDRVTRSIHRLQKHAARNAWAIGRKLAQVRDLGLHKARGFATVVEYVERALALPASTAFQYMRVAEAFGSQVVATYGVAKLDRGLVYISRTPEAEEPADLPELRVRVPAEDGGEAVEKPFAETSLAELQRAAQAAPGTAAARKRRRPAAPEQAAAVVTAAERALDGAVGRGRRDGAEVSARLDGDEVLLDVRGVPLARAAAAFRALAGAVR